MIYDLVKKITGIERDAKYTGAAAKIKYAADILLYIAVSFYLVVIGAALPLYLPGYESLGTDKGLFWIKYIGISGKILLIPIAVYILFYLICFITKQSVNKPVIHTSDIWAVAFCVSVVISYSLSDEKGITFYGERGWYLGTFSYLALGIGAIVVPRLGKARNLFYPVIMTASFAVSFIGILMDHAGNIFNIESWTQARISTIGNTNWFCGYLITVMFAGPAVFFLDRSFSNLKDKLLIAITVIYMCVTFYMMIAQGSASAYPAIWAVLLALMILSGKDLVKIFRVLLIIFMGWACAFLHALFIGRGGYGRANDLIGKTLEDPKTDVVFLVFFLILITVAYVLIKKGKTETGINSGIILTTLTGAAVLIYLLLLIANTKSGVGYLGKEGLFWFDNEWGSDRGATISIGFELFKGMTPLEKLFGKGPDSFYSFMMSGRFPETALKCLEIFGGARLTNAHCEPLTMLVNTGVAGTVTYYGLMACVMVKGFKKASVNPSKGSAGVLACSLGILAYIINNIFSFQTAVNVSQLSLVLAFGAWFVIRDKSEDG